MERKTSFLHLTWVGIPGCSPESLPSQISCVSSQNYFGAFTNTWRYVNTHFLHFKKSPLFFFSLSGKMSFPMLHTGGKGCLHSPDLDFRSPPAQRKQMASAGYKFHPCAGIRPGDTGPPAPAPAPGRGGRRSHSPRASAA